MNFFKKLFGGGKKSEDGPVESLVRSTLEGLIEYGQFNLEYTFLSESEDAENKSIHIELSGADEELFKDRKGQLLDSFQLILKRVVQHQIPDDKTNINVDCGGYREENEQALIERAENLKTIAIEQNKAVYYRALPPKERKVVHQYLSKDERVKSRSLGDGLYKKIKIFPAKNFGSQKDDLTSQE
ncbi:MAG: hypothetical protein J0M15_01125 [Deltaproteobacteria bacterium]|jgi:spoIIIJ-associated protein|nr:hypothetical protein [Deltaproteobacteria bacterium]